MELSDILLDKTKKYFNLSLILLIGDNLTKKFDKNYVDIEAVRRKKVRVIKDKEVEQGTIRVNPADFEAIVDILKGSLGRYLNFYKGGD